MPDKKVAFKKENNLWIVESQNGDTYKRSEHRSRIKALVAFFIRYTGIRLFYIVIPDHTGGKHGLK